MIQGRVLVIAGSDCSGGAGLEADQKVLAAHGCYAMTATTALTVQNTTGVKGIHVVPADFVEQQIEACLEDVGVDVVKTGMLAAADTIDMVARQITKHGVGSLVVDPVMVSTSGAQLLPQEAVRGLSNHLFPLTTVLTPNIPEAVLILGENGNPALAKRQICSVADIESVGRHIQALGPEWVLVKGGHLPFRSDMTVAETEDEKHVVVDILVGPGGKVFRVQSPYQATSSTHGTGCSLASSIAAGIAKGMDVPRAVRSACRYIEAGIRNAPELGRGNGPLNHFHSVQILPFAPGYFIEYLLQRPDVKHVWETFLHHPFVMALGNGTLPLESFKGYIIQDYLYLVHFSRANALAAYKSKDIESIGRTNEIVGHIIHEMQLHVGYCEKFGISEDQIRKTEEKQGKPTPSYPPATQKAPNPLPSQSRPPCTAYTRYVLDTGQSEDWLALQMALAPCLLGYGAVAQMLHSHDLTRRDDNAYWPWIQNYAADGYKRAVRLGTELLEKHIRLQSPSRIEELVGIFIHATKMETGFWEMFPYR
ncbi:Phosphomethylpyrimidine kinase type-1 [Metarhizium rileyi]|uniref:Phosphomethylpyrimidine kinase type-1 n=1 Tax=Metarhizium rileyi (strain RCEF 4871) TaxID=1649241 RepID=A0A167CCA3_METRR|nr:Phosphomethylpyrimidine kinase type-1 [Metarhizium rileyi RCEF 4871]